VAILHEFKQTPYISRKSFSGFEPGMDGFRVLVGWGTYGKTAFGRCRLRYEDNNKMDVKQELALIWFICFKTETVCELL
jgi:hypothetical protein